MPDDRVGPTGDGIREGSIGHGSGMLRPFTLHQPTSVGEALGLLDELGDEAMLYAGGTELLLAMKAGLLRVPHLVDVKLVGLSGTWVDDTDGSLHIGAGATHRAIETSHLVRRHSPILADMEGRIANVRVRSAGTLGGNICFNEPHADPGAVLALLDATITIEGEPGRRGVGWGEFFVDPFETAAGEKAIVTEIVIPPAPDGQVGVYLRFGHLERPMIGVGCVAVPSADGTRVEEVRLSVGAVGPRPQRLHRLEEDLRDSDRASVSEAVSRVAAAAPDQCEVFEDTYGSAEYKRHLVEVLVGRALTATVGRLGSDRVEGG